MLLREIGIIQQYNQHDALILSALNDFDIDEYQFDEGISDKLSAIGTKISSGLDSGVDFLIDNFKKAVERSLKATSTMHGKGYIPSGPNRNKSTSNAYLINVAIDNYKKRWLRVQQELDLLQNSKFAWVKKHATTIRANIEKEHSVYGINSGRTGIVLDKYFDISRKSTWLLCWLFVIKFIRFWIGNGAQDAVVNLVATLLGPLATVLNYILNAKDAKDAVKLALEIAQQVKEGSDKVKKLKKALAGKTDRTEPSQVKDPNE